MSSLKVVLCDDDGARVKRWKDEIDSVAGLGDLATVKALTPREFADVYKALEKRQLAARQGTAPAGEDAAIALDDADIVVVDFDLTPRQQEEMADQQLEQLVGSFGDVFAYLARCYSTAGFTVLVNQTFFQPTFDLTMTAFNYSFADLNISDSDLGRASLWFGESSDGDFRPWHWPRLLSAPGQMRHIIEHLQPDAKVAEQFAWDDDIVGLFEPSQIEPLGLQADRGLSDLRFSDFASAQCSFGRRSASEELDATQLRRLAAAAFNHWLERFILPSQNVYVDAPHLAERHPQLVKNDSWHELTKLSQSDLSPFLDVHEPEGSSESLYQWASRPTWLTLDVEDDAADLDAPDAPVFCEDISDFRAVDQAVEFRASVAGPWTQRFVSRDLADRFTDETELGVDFRPETRFYE